MTSDSVAFHPRVDPITFEVVRHALWQVNDEQGRTIINVSGSPVASEVNDFNVALTTPDGELVMIGPYLLHQMGAISVVIKEAVELLGDDVKPGDFYLTNDPWMGALHHNDVCCVSPVFVEGELIAWSACTVHQVDVGGPTPGSWSMDARDTFQEAPRYRFLKVLRDGEVQREVVATYLTNSRTPELLELDLRAMIASSNVVKERLSALCEKYGRQTVSTVMEDCIEYTAALFRRRLQDIPDGEWYAEDYMDHDGWREKVYAIRVHLRKKGTHLEFDYRDTDEQASGFVNCTYAGCLAGTLSPIMTQLCSDIPWNHGILRCMTIETREGLVNNAKFPAPTGMGTVSGCRHTSNAAMAAVARMLNCSEPLLDRLMANWSGSAYVYNVFGESQYGKPFGTMMVDSHLSGGGARYIGDGHDTAGSLAVPRASAANVESLEARFPILYLYRRRTQDSGGAGRHRGGVSAESAITPYGTDKLAVTVSTQGGDHSSAHGVAGGYPGGGSNAILVRDCDAITALQSGTLTPDPETWGGSYEVLPPKERFELRTGDVFIGVPHGGGGLGDPLLRSPDAVMHDVREGYVSMEQARKAYGVVFEPNGIHVAHDATVEERDRIRTERIGLADLPDEQGSAERPLDEDAPFVRVNEGLLCQDEHLYCSSCRKALASLTDRLSDRVGWIQGDLGRAGRWICKRFDGHSPNFDLMEMLCPHCGALIEVYQWHREGPRDPRDFGYDIQQIRAGTV